MLVETEGGKEERRLRNIEVGRENRSGRDRGRW